LGETSVAVDAGLSGEQLRWLRAAEALVDQDRLAEVLVQLVNVPSPTGQEGQLAELIADHLTSIGAEGHQQAIGASQANVWGVLPGRRPTPELMLYAPIDTLTTGDPARDLPWIGDALQPEQEARASVSPPFVSGLGASNTKGHAACILVAMEALAKAGVPLEGGLVAAFGAGGMPNNRVVGDPSGRENTGHGAGLAFMLQRGLWARNAIIAKPGWSVSHEEVGLSWFTVRVKGTYNYVGSRHRMAYVNPIVGASKVVLLLEEWLPSYAAEWTRGTLTPQGQVGNIRGGWKHTAAVSPAMAELTLDLRTHPDLNPVAAQELFSDVMGSIAAKLPDYEIDWQPSLLIPGTSTPADALVCRVARQAWEHIEDRPHEEIFGVSGSTDANILRGSGIPTARIGMDRIGADAPMDLNFSTGMNVADTREMVKLTRHMLYMAVAICARSAIEE
jgi:acetylornithine deacetylase/succinyl-diaminopimelate desuccinylase-like protein